MSCAGGVQESVPQAGNALPGGGFQVHAGCDTTPPPAHSYVDAVARCLRTARRCVTMLQAAPPRALPSAAASVRRLLRCLRRGPPGGQGAEDFEADAMLGSYCKKDADKLCSDVPPGAGRVQACLNSLVSPPPPPPPPFRLRTCWLLDLQDKGSQIS